MQSARLAVVAPSYSVEGCRLWRIALGNHSYSAWHPCGDWGTPFENSRRWKVATMYDAATITQLLAATNRKPKKMKLPYEELTTRQLVQHMRDAIHREEW